MYEGVSIGPKRYRITDRYMFGSVFREPDLCRRLLEATLDVQIERVEFIEREFVLEADPMARGIRADVYVRDGKGTVFNVEMQNERFDNLPRRSRYSLAMLDLDRLDRRNDYDKLGAAYVIFFCAGNPFGRGLRRYTYLPTCAEDGEVLHDGTTRIFLNARGYHGEVSEDLDAFLRYLAGDDTIENDLVRDVETRVAYYNADPVWRRNLMNQHQILADERMYARREGRAEGLAEGRAEGRAEERAAIGRLAEMMAAEGRTDEFLAGLSDEGALAALIEEHGLAI